MPFTKKFPNAGETIHIRVPKSYKESVIELCIALDSKFQQDVTKGNTTIRKFIRNSLTNKIRFFGNFQKLLEIL